MCSIPGGEPESLENDDQLDPEVASTGPALFLCCCWILIHLIAYIEPESLENDDQLDPEVASYGPSTGPALFLCCCWILIHLIAYILLLKESKFS